MKILWTCQAKAHSSLENRCRLCKSVETRTSGTISPWKKEIPLTLDSTLRPYNLRVQTVKRISLGTQNFKMPNKASNLRVKTMQILLRWRQKTSHWRCKETIAQSQLIQSIAQSAISARLQEIWALGEFRPFKILACFLRMLNVELNNHQWLSIWQMIKICRPLIKD